MLRASTPENQDLFWGVRGGGGNFGAVTSFEFGLHRVGPQLLGGRIVFPFDQARDVLRFYSEFSHDAPPELWMEAIVAAIPGGPRVVFVDTCYSGSPSAGEKVLQPLRSFGKPAQDVIAAAPYVDLQSRNDGNVPHGRCYSRGRVS